MSINSDLQAARAMFNPAPVEVIKESETPVVSEAKTSKNAGHAIFNSIKSAGVYWTDALPEALSELEGFLIEFLQDAEDDKAVKVNIELVKKMIVLADKFKEME